MFIAKDPVNTGVPFDLAGKTTVFGQESGSTVRTGMVLQTFPQKVFHRNGKLPEIIMDTDKIPTSLIKPATGRVDQPRGIQLPYHVCDADGIKLSPAFVKRAVNSNGREKFQVSNSIPAFLLETVPVCLILPGKQRIIVITDLIAQGLGNGRKVAYKGHGIRAAPINHVLTDDHAKTVTVIIPACHFYLDMFTQHVISQRLHYLDIIDQCFIGGSCIQTLRPVALIQSAHQEAGCMIQAENRDISGRF